MAKFRYALLISLLLLAALGLTLASIGDSSVVYRQCMKWCYDIYCGKGRGMEYDKKLPWYHWYMGWTCIFNCEYECMWRTVVEFDVKDSRTPQFYGKWPFIRFFGIQEPASTFFSITNLLGVLYGLKCFRARVPSSAPNYWLWHSHCFVACNAWIWSTVFHARDFPFSEKMDYFCAILLVMYSLFTCIVRLNMNDRAIQSIAFICLGSFYCYHVYNLAFIKFDYGYNMQINVTIGALNIIAWMGWCNAAKDDQRYVWKAGVSVVFTGLLLMLELWDFAPILWIFDAHSLWHAGTSPLCILWLEFCADDSRYLLQKKLERARGGGTTGSTSNHVAAGGNTNEEGGPEDLPEELR